MFNYYASELSIETVKKIVQSYESVEAPYLDKNFNYYNGKQAIYQKTAPENRPNNQVVTNFCRQIADTYLGFIDLIHAQTSDSFLDANLTVLSDVIRDVLISSVGYTLRYYNEGDMSLAKLRPTTTLVIRDTTVAHNVIAAATWNKYKVYEYGYPKDVCELYVYDEMYCYYYKGSSVLDCKFIDKSEHYMKEVPINEFRMTSHYENIFGSIIDLQDSYNTIDSSYVDGRETFSNSYLLIKGMLVDSDSVSTLIDGTNKIINLPQADTDASYLTKEDSATEVINMLSDIRLRIFTVTATPDFLASNFSAASGTAMKYRLIGFINNVTAIESEFIRTLYDITDSEFTFSSLTIKTLDSAVSEN